MSSHNAESEFRRADGVPWEGARTTVYLSGGQLRVTIEVDGTRIDLSWQKWGDLVADVGETFVGLALRTPAVLEAARAPNQVFRMRQALEAFKRKKGT